MQSLTVCTGNRVGLNIGSTALLGLSALALPILAAQILGGNYADAMSYAAGASAVWSGHSPYSAMQMQPYALHWAAAGRGFVYPPSAAFLLGPFALGLPFWVAWDVATVVALAYVGWRLLGRWGIPLGLWLATIANLDAGQTSGMVAALVGMMWVHRSATLPVIGGLLKMYPLAGIAWSARTKGNLWALALIPVAVAILPYWPEWSIALRNGHAGCPSWALPSFACAGVPWLGYLLSALLVAGVLLVRRDELAFALLGLAMIAPAPDIYTGYLVIPAMTALPLLRWVYEQRLVERLKAVDVQVVEGA